MHKDTKAEGAAQCIVDGKSIIIEGMHLDPGLYLYEFARYSQAHLTEKLSRRRSLKYPELKHLSPLEQDTATKEKTLQADTADAAGSSPDDDLRYAYTCLIRI